ncbi:hypothetical protein ZWY2020_003670 [Hordeum vulgare]|nr:hypothetical protein ZWY2020_003670 [Hordeum vulgare]
MSSTSADDPSSSCRDKGVSPEMDVHDGCETGLPSGCWFMDMCVNRTRTRHGCCAVDLTDEANYSPSLI